MPPFVIEDFVKVERNTLRGFAKVRTPSGIIFHDVAIHHQADAAWAAPASKPLLNRDPGRCNPATDRRVEPADPVELDAIPPNILRRFVRDAIERHITPARLAVIEAAEASERNAAEMFIRRINGDAA